MLRDDEKARLMNELDEFEIVDGVCRWKVNGNCVPTDILEFYCEAGVITPEVLHDTESAALKDMEAFIEQYKEARANRSPEEIAEERAEMRAAFGPGEWVLNVFTGEVTEL